MEPSNLLSSGAVNFGELLEPSGPSKAREYAASETQAVYQSQVVDLDDKHIELALCAFCEVTYPADADLYEGRITTRNELDGISTLLEAEGLSARGT